MYANGVIVNAGVNIEDGCAIDYHLCGEEVEFMLGGRHGVALVAAEAGLRRLVATASEALDALQAQPADTE